MKIYTISSVLSWISRDLLISSILQNNTDFINLVDIYHFYIFALII